MIVQPTPAGSRRRRVRDRFRRLLSRVLSIALLGFGASSSAAVQPTVVEERIDLYDPVSFAYLGTERTTWSPDGRRLRRETRGPRGERVLIFLVHHDGAHREAGAVYFEGEAEEPSWEMFTWSDDGRGKTLTYYLEPGVAGERTEIDLDDHGREATKRYFRADGSLYGVEKVGWNADGSQRGWDFRYVNESGGASFRYEYAEERDEDGSWLRRTRRRDGAEERVEVRTLVRLGSRRPPITPLRFAPGLVSTEASESSPSISRDGTTLVFARYDDDWTAKRPFVARAGAAGWSVEPLPLPGDVYNLAISPDGQTVVFAMRTDRGLTLHRVRQGSDGWSSPESLSERFGLSGSYPCLTEDGSLVYFDADGADGAGIYAAPAEGDSFQPPAALYVPAEGIAFGAWAAERAGPLWLTRCFDEACESGPRNGIWHVRSGHGAPDDPGVEKLESLPYGWGVQPVEALGILLFTEGEDILAVPLAAVRKR